MIVRNVYRASFDLVRNNVTIYESKPAEERLLIAADIKAAYDMAHAMRNELRVGAVHKELSVRSIKLVYANVVVSL